MAKKQINVFGASFLDLLSGALGAVIILYVIVPKMDVPVEEYEEQKRIAEEIAALGLSVEEISELIPRFDEEELADQMRLIEDLEQQIREMEEEAESTREALEQCKQGRADCEEDLEKIEGDARFLVVVMSWSTANHDVDLHVVDPDGNEFMYDSRTFPGVEGELTVDNTCGPGYEVWNIAAPKEGEYEIYTNLYSRNGCEDGNPENGMAEVTIYHRNGVESYESIELVNEQEKVLISTANIPGSGLITFN